MYSAEANDESIFTILCAERHAHGLEQLQHCERNDHIEPAGEPFGPAIDRRQLAGAGSLSLPPRVQNSVVSNIKRSRRVPDSNWSLSGHP
jgi:hypothetical protein